MVSYNYSITVYLSNYTSNNVWFNFSNIGLPIVNQNLAISLNSYTVNNYSISYGTLAIWQPICNLPCQTCSVNNRNLCLSCYSNPLITTLNLYDIINNKCIDQCA